MKISSYLTYSFSFITSIINVNSYIHKGIGRGTHYFTNLQEPFRDINRVSIARSIAFSKNCINEIYKITDTHDYIKENNIRILYENLNYHKYGEILREINSFEYLISTNYENIVCLLWCPSPRVFNVQKEPLSLIVYTNDTKNVKINNVIFNPLWNNNKMPMIELKYALDSYFEQNYNNDIIDYTELYTNNKNIKEIWDNYKL
tara:strand:- start:334 stop:942 length:609 start_codon:yes stop_codon:yes gene_type:complete